jgi:hypothetical protein
MIFSFDKKYIKNILLSWVSSAGLFTSTITGLICQTLKRFRGECQTIAGGWGERGSILHQSGDHPHKSKLHMGRFETIGSSYTWILEYSPSNCKLKEFMEQAHWIWD